MENETESPFGRVVIVGGGSQCGRTAMLVAMLEATMTCEASPNVILATQDQFVRFSDAGHGAEYFRVMEGFPELDLRALPMPPDARHGKSAGQLRREVYGREKNGRNLPRGRR
jgi:hypothetical protein